MEGLSNSIKMKDTILMKIKNYDMNKEIMEQITNLENDIEFAAQSGQSVEGLIQQLNSLKRTVLLLRQRGLLQHPLMRLLFHEHLKHFYLIYFLALHLLQMCLQKTNMFEQFYSLHSKRMS